MIYGNRMSVIESTIFDNLIGSFLISTQKMPDPRFEEQVIYVCSHSEEGAMGVVINRPSNMFSLMEIFQSAQLGIPNHPLPPVYIGGPVGLESAFILYPSSYKAEFQLEVSESVSLSRESKVLEDISKNQGPEKFLFLLGYAGWGPGQLESELVEDGWLTVPANDAIIFDTPDNEKWRTAAALYGIDISTFGDTIGRA